MRRKGKYNVASMRDSLVATVRGMHDILPDRIDKWHRLERTAAQCFAGYGYGEIRTPLVEPLALFERQLGEESDVVQKEMYVLEDRGERLALRPEATVSTVRALLAAGWQRRGILRVWYGGAMFRRERPQKGRYRQFHQLGAEILGGGDPAMEVEQILMLSRLWKRLGIGDQLCLRLNNLGAGEERNRHRQALVEYFERHEGALDEDSRRRLRTNPLRIFDSKTPSVRALIPEAPKLSAFVGDDSIRHLEWIKARLQAAGVSFVEDGSLVRGLDYYNLTVYEWQLRGDERQQNTVCGGGRYDGLAEMLGAAALPACGFAFGVERVLDLMPDPPAAAAQCYLMVADEAYSDFANRLAERCRDDGWSVCQHVGGGNLGRQMRKADASGARVALIVGEKEYYNNQVTVKRLSDGRQETIDEKEISSQLQTFLNPS